MNLIERDLRHIWHPCSQMKDYESFHPLVIKRAKGCFLELHNGQKVIDAISSWWCKSLGHNHPRLKKALLRQLSQYEHVIGTNTCQEPLVLLSEKLTHLTQTLKKVFYASEGSSAIEIALKMSLHSRKVRGETRTCFMALENSYHGETTLALAVSDLKLYRAPYECLLPKISFLKGIPYVSTKNDPLWHSCSSHWPAIEAQLDNYKDSLTALIVEPILQAAGGMQIYSQDFLRRLRQWTAKHHIHLICDEIMTGLGRAGLPLASHHAQIEPDILCLSKGLTAGMLPMSAVLITQDLYDTFYDDYEKGNSFLHSHTYSGNALSAAVALETLNLLEEEDIYTHVLKKESLLFDLMQEVSEKTGKLNNLRGIGGMVAGDLESSSKKRLGFEVFKAACRKGAFLRPLGNTLYWCPPLNTSIKILNRLKKITLQCILEVCK